MKTLLQTINETVLSNWGVGSTDNYVRRIKQMLKEYLDKEVSNAEKIEKRKARYAKRGGAAYTGDIKNVTFKSYPIAIAIDKLNYKAETVFTNSRSGKINYDYAKFSKWLAEQINSEKVSIEDLATWWHDADAAAAKAKWFDYKKIAKDIDPEKVWDPYYPDSTAIIDKFKKEPFSIVWYLKDDTKFKTYSLTNNEKDELRDFLADPANVVMANKLIDKLIPKFEAVRPTVSSAIEKFFKYTFERASSNIILKGSYFSDVKDINKFFGKQERGTWYHGQSNGESVAGKAIQSIIIKAFKNAFPKEDDLLKALQGGERIVITDLGLSKHETSDVHNSSFWSTYAHDFNVDLFIYPNTKDIENSKPDYSEEFKNVTVYQEYISAGWN